MKKYENRSSVFIIVLLLVWFLSIRIWILCFSPLTFHEGELYRGTIAKEILEGRSWPLLLYQNAPNEGGSLIIGIISASFFLLFGQSLLTLKFVSLFLALLSFIVILHFIWRYYELNTALLTALAVVVFSPSIFLIHPVYGQIYRSFLPYVSAIDLLFNEGRESKNILSASKKYVV